MKKLIAGVVLGVSLSATAVAAGDPEAGKANAAVCASCHGATGAEPIMSTYPKIANLGERYLFQQMVHVREGRRVIPEMTGLLDNMSDQDLRDLAAYYNQQTMTIGEADPELVERGQALYRGGNLAAGIPACAACHSPNGKGNEPAGYPRLSGQTADYIAKALREYRAGTRNVDSNSQIMIDIATRMHDTEIDALASYISGLH